MFSIGLDNDYVPNKHRSDEPVMDHFADTHMHCQTLISLSIYHKKQFGMKIYIYMYRKLDKGYLLGK